MMITRFVKADVLIFKHEHRLLPAIFIVLEMDFTNEAADECN